MDVASKDQEGNDHDRDYFRRKGKGKTKELLNKVNTSITSATGNIVYLDKSQKHMYELNNKIRLINVNDFLIDNCDEFLSFICDCDITGSRS